jgi:acyl-CoA reductase-like NAD-dependent aldehyde dehydrogenase
MPAEILNTISPTTHEVVVTRTGATPKELDRMSEVATAAFAAFRALKFAERKAIVEKALGILAAQHDELALDLTVQMGRPIAYTGKEVATAIKRAEFLVKISEDVLADTEGEPEAGFKRYIRKVPVGPILVIFAWNVCCLLFF